ncbi:HNH endonuclease [Modicisalibacter xianhensis]|uniref:HNH endonuclease n=1 Tax=Modicisalibacter xianhensis TaxID=442341 RepID=A0A4R8G436_9GAMM|nr:HNH endonuclease signature motif containing protein [Halomonas xianhensis]TDX30805.1 HNH endonuclease [Halomonas xianhensis]
MRNHGKRWSPQDDDDLRRLYPTNEIRVLEKIFGRPEKAITARAHRLGLTKAPDYVPPRRGVFEKGQKPWNKGTHFSPPGSEKGRFKKGQRPHTWVPIGTERVSKDGILERKVTDAGPAKDHFCSVHSIIWEERHGPIPEGHIVRFKSDDKRNFDDDNLELVSRAENMQRNSYHRYGPEIAQLYQLKGALSRKINRRSRDLENQNHRSA